MNLSVIAMLPMVDVFLLDHTLPNYVKNNIASLFWTNKKLHFYIQS